MHEEKKSLASYDQELSQLENDLKKKLKENSDIKLELQKLNIEYESCFSECDQAKKNLVSLVDNYSWIPDQKQ